MDRSEGERENEEKFDPTSYEIIVKSINFDATEDDIKDFFATYGEVTKVNLERRYYDGRSKGSAFVTFNSEVAREAAVADSGVELMGRPIRIEKTRSKEERMKEYGDKPRYERGRGARGGRGRGGRGGRGRGRGGRRYDDDEEEGGYNNNRNRSYSDEEFDRYEERPRRGGRGAGRGGRGAGRGAGRGRGGHREPRPVVTESDVIFVGNLNYKADVDDLWDHFEQCGEVNEVRISKYPDGRVNLFYQRIEKGIRSR